MRTFPAAKRLECVELAPAFGAATFDDSASELDALQTLRVTEMPLFPDVSAFKAAHTNGPGAGGGAFMRRDQNYSRMTGQAPRTLPKCRRSVENSADAGSGVTGFPLASR